MRIAEDLRGTTTETKLLLLGASGPDDLSPAVQSSIANHEFEVVQHQITIDYEWYTAEQVLSALLPSGGAAESSVDGTNTSANGTPTSYTTIGHLAHLNLRDSYLPYRFLIARVILDKNAQTLRTVVNKLDSIDNEFRFFAMELLAGEPDYTVTSNESGCLFTFDFRKVYFNSRLHTEHARIVSLLRRGDQIGRGNLPGD